MFLKREVSAEELNEAVRRAAEGPYDRVIEYSTEPLVSSDIVGNPHSAIFDSQLTRTMGRMAKIFVWYDNEWGYSERMADVLELMLAA